ncbi:MAG: Ig-like domain-containing protein [Gemmatimonadota bacterium]|nr:Ig-like domain-containing protein [Gemmatimonadota bacterium]
MVTRIDLSPTASDVFPNETQQFSAALYGANGALISGAGVTVTWTVDDATVASVSGAGLFEAIKPGEVTLSVRAGGVTATAVVDVRILGTYVLRTANAITLPALITQGLTCPPSATSSGQITVNSGSLSFLRARGITPISADAALNAVEDCGNSGSIYGGTGGELYTVKGNTIIWGRNGGWQFAPSARLSNDSIFLRWKGDRSATDTLNFIYTKQ